MKNLSTGRARLVSRLLAGCFGVVMLRLFLLQIMNHAEMKAAAEGVRSLKQVGHAWRGQIDSRQGIPLAVTRPVKDVYANLAVWVGQEDRLSQVLGPLLGRSPEQVAKRVRAGIDRLKQRGVPVVGATLLRRSLRPEEWSDVQDALARETFGLPTRHQEDWQKRQLHRFRHQSLHSEDDQSRLYPYGPVGSPLIGLTGEGLNGYRLEGKSGVELFFNRGLAGENGRYVRKSWTRGCEGQRSWNALM